MPFVRVISPPIHLHFLVLGTIFIPSRQSQAWAFFGFGRHSCEHDTPEQPLLSKIGEYIAFTFKWPITDKVTCLPDNGTYISLLMKTLLFAKHKRKILICFVRYECWADSRKRGSMFLGFKNTVAASLFSFRKRSMLSQRPSCNSGASEFKQFNIELNINQGTVELLVKVGRLWIME